MKPLPGIDVLKADDFAPLRGQRVGLFSNPSAVDSALVDTVTLLHRAPDVMLAALFSAEHGLTAATPDGVQIDHATDPHTGLPVYSLYGERYRPTAAMLDGLDCLVIDIQDIGTRYYTYLWTATHIIEACGEYGLPVLILDRPNPLGGTIDGPPLDPAYESLVGRYNIPVQHGMTLGEMAEMLNAEHNITPPRVTVIRCANWSRRQRWAATGLPFVPPSPNMPHPITADHYPGACLIEGTTLSEGRGTPLPFEITGAPGLDGHALADQLNVLDLPGVRFRPHTFIPTASKHAGAVCGGVQAHITDSMTYRPVRTWLHVIATLRRQHPDSFDWRAPHFDRLAGGDTVRTIIDSAGDLDALIGSWTAYHAMFRARRAPYLIYPD